MMLLASMDDEVLLNCGLLLKERIFSIGANPFLYESTLFEKEGKNDIGRVTAPNSVPSHSKSFGHSECVRVEYIYKKIILIIKGGANCR